ncbi:hypothetical protein AK812_SmicGene1895 [Symbiodinium microadriaticum]|uniref:Uncharacterized protein n=1 Tax=Symbiodinium microadriaticum TaxID=2951 RepID=A0A1Q9F2R3_SYMMI|nr:hypothetical protein AK812_SmicGene1895 [Symbiodinium microadriaticum]
MTFTLSMRFVGCQSFTRDDPFCDPPRLDAQKGYDLLLEALVEILEAMLHLHAAGFLQKQADQVLTSKRLRTAAVPAKAPENLTTTDVRKYRYELLWVMTKPVGVDWPPEDQDNATIAVAQALGAWGYLQFPGVTTAMPVQADRLANVTIVWNWPSLSLRFLAGEEGDCVFAGWYVEVSLPSSPDDWVVRDLVIRVEVGCDIHTGLEYGTESLESLREGWEYGSGICRYACLRARLPGG